MSFYRGMTCENVTIKGDKGTPITAYVARPSGPGPFPGVVLVHHLPGWSEFYIETTRRFAHHGHLAICANLYEREGGGSDGNPDDVAAKVRARAALPTPRWSAIPKPPLPSILRVSLFAQDRRRSDPVACNDRRLIRACGPSREGKLYFHTLSGRGQPKITRIGHGPRAA
jgi:Dienelactone hydrolase family